MTSTLASDPGLSGYFVLPKSIDSIPESLRRLGHALSKQGFTIAIYRASPATLPRGPAVVGTTMGWLLTWWRMTSHGLAACGSLWAADGVEAVILSTSG